MAAAAPAFGTGRDIETAARQDCNLAGPEEGRMEDERNGDGMSRRTVIGAAAASLAAGAASAEQAPQAQPHVQAQQHVKGPRVWLDFDQQELDDAYDQSKYAPNRDQMNRRRASISEEVRARLGAPRRIAYGAAPIEGVDVYVAPKSDAPKSEAQNAGAPIAIFVHGGAWRAGTARDSAYGAEPFIRAGAHFAVLDFVNVIESGGDLMAMISGVRRGIAAVANNAASFGGDPGRIYLMGHSSGAHLAGCALITDWEKDHGVPKDVIKGATLCSGMYDVKPARLSARSNYVKFTDAMEDALSAQRHLDRIVCPVTVLHGTLETPEFQRQSRDFAAAMKAAGKPVRLIVGNGYNHFEIGETLNNPYGPFGRAALETMRLAVG
jgi:arylformamidase